MGFQWLDDAVEGASDFFEQRGISPVAGIGFTLLVLLGILFVLLSQQQTTELKTIVTSSGQILSGARVQLFAQDGSLIASGLTTQDGQIVFSEKLPSTGRVTLKVSKPGYVAADGSRQAVAVIDLARKKGASVELYASEVAGGEVGEGISFTLLDALSKQPVQGASIAAVVGTRTVFLSTDLQGKAFLAAASGESIKLRISAANYVPETRQLTAIRGEETILLNPRIGETTFLSSPGTLPKINAGGEAGASSQGILEESTVVPNQLVLPDATLNVKDSFGNAVQSGALQVISSSGQVLATTQVSNGVAQLSGLPISSGFSIQVSGAQSGSVSVVDPFSNNLLFSGSLENGQASLSLIPRKSLGVSVKTSAGQAAPSGMIRVHDAATSAFLAEFSLANGFALVESAAIAANTRIKIVLGASGYSAQPVEAIFGKDSSASITATDVGGQNFKDTTLRAQGENAPISAQVRVFRQGSSTPVFEGIFSGAKTISLQSGATYSAVFSSPGRYSYTFSLFEAGSTLDAILPLAGSSVSASECITFGAQSCTLAQFSPDQVLALEVSVKDSSGAGLQGVAVAVRDSGQRTLEVQSTNPAGQVSFTGLAPGSYELVASQAGFSASKTISLSSSTQETFVLELFGTLLLAATSMQSGSNLQATFSVEGGASCSARSCSLQVPANREVKVTAFAQGHSTATAARKVSPGQVLPTTFELVPSSSQLEITFRGLRDSLGRQVSSVLPGQDYFAEFSLYSSGEFSETEAMIRLGEASSVREQGYGLLDFQAPVGFFAVRSTTFSLHPLCLDDNNANPDNGLFKSARLQFENQGAPLHYLLSLPLRVKASVVEERLKIFYRIQGRDEAGAVLRKPFDEQLGSSESSESRAGCYAASLSTEVVIASPSASQGASCQIASRVFQDGECLPTAPGKCANGFESSDPAACGCPAGRIVSGNSCVAPTCSDGTPVGQCSRSAQNSLKKCVSINQQLQLTNSFDCSCPAGTERVSGACMACSTPDCGAAVTCSFNGVAYSQGCVPNTELNCNADGSLSAAPTQCGCAAGQEFDATTNSCISVARPACDDGTLVGECSRQQPGKCVAVGGQLFLVNDAGGCGCPAGMISDGVDCRTAEVSPTPGPGGVTPIPTEFPSATPLPQPTPEVELCSMPGQCISEDNSDSYCTPQGTVANSCLICNSLCGGSSQHKCDATSGRCVALKCAAPFPVGTPAGQCVEGGNGIRCSLVDGQAKLEIRTDLCHCQAGFKKSGNECVACTDANCADASTACSTSDGRRHAVGCLPSQYSKEFGDAGAEPIKKCEASGSVVPALGECGCPAPYMRTFDGTACILDPATQPPEDEGGQPALPPQVTCPGCSGKDTIFFNRVIGRLVTRSGGIELKMRADTFFPADGLPIDIDSGSSTFRISVQGITSATHTESCYSYDAAKKLLIFKAIPPCPIEVRANKFFHNVENKLVTSDSAKLVLRHESVPFQEIELNVSVELVAMESVHAQPLALQGPDTPQLVYLINNKQTSFGPRLLQVQGQTLDNNQLQGAGVKVLAWRGPGGLSVSEKTIPLASFSYERIASYFVCTGETGPRIEQASGPFDCAGGWCNGQAFHQMFSAFRQYANVTWHQTAGRRGGGEPFASVAPLLGGELKPFELFTAAQVVHGSGAIVEGHGIALSSFSDCSGNVNPGVYSIRATTTDGRKFSYDAKTATLHKFDYVDGACPDNAIFSPAANSAEAPEQHLCDFLYGGNCACLYRSKHSNFATQPQHKDANAFMNMLQMLSKLAPQLQKLLKSRMGGRGGLGGGMGGVDGGQGGVGEGGGDGTGAGTALAALCEPGGLGTCGINGCGGPAFVSAGTPAASFDSTIKKINFGENSDDLPQKEFLASRLDFQTIPVGTLRDLGVANLFCQLRGVGNRPSTNRDVVFGANQFGESCRSYDNVFRQKRLETDQKCGPSLRRNLPPAGGTHYWVMPLIAVHPITITGANDLPGFLGTCTLILSCTVNSFFQMASMFYQNNMEFAQNYFLDLFDAHCLDQPHPAPFRNGNGRPSLTPQCQKVFADFQSFVNLGIDHITEQKAQCINQCLSSANAGEVCGWMCMATAGAPCVRECTTTASIALSQFTTRTAACQLAMREEVTAADSCTALSRDLSESATTFSIGRPRMSWAWCQPCGETNCDSNDPKQTAPIESAQSWNRPGSCIPVVQEQYSTTQVGVRNNFNQQVYRWGIAEIGAPSGDPFDRPPALKATAQAQDPNTLSSFLAAGGSNPFGGFPRTAAHPVPNAQIGPGSAVFTVVSSQAGSAVSTAPQYTIISFDHERRQTQQPLLLGTSAPLGGVLRPRVPLNTQAPASTRGFPWDPVPPSVGQKSPPSVGQKSGTGGTGVFDEGTSVQGGWTRKPFPPKQSLSRLRRQAAEDIDDQYNTAAIEQGHRLAGEQPDNNHPPNPDRTEDPQEMGDGGSSSGGGDDKNKFKEELKKAFEKAPELLKKLLENKDAQQHGNAQLWEDCSDSSQCASGRRCIVQDGSVSAGSSGASGSGTAATVGTAAGSSAGRGFCSQGCSSDAQCPVQAALGPGDEKALGPDGQLRKYTCCTDEECRESKGFCVRRA